jgi:hypothetical protein
LIQLFETPIVVIFLKVFIAMENTLESDRQDIGQTLRKIV